MSFRVRETAPEDYADLHRSLDEPDVLLLLDGVRHEACPVALTAAAPDGSVLGVGWIAGRRELATGPSGLELNVVATTPGVATALGEAALTRARDAGLGTVFGDSQRLSRSVQQALEHRWHAERWPTDSDFWEVRLDRT